MKKGSTESSTGCRSKRKGILVIAPNWIGDAVMATPFLVLLRKVFNEHTITVLAKSYVSEIFRRNSSVDNLVETESVDPIVIVKILRNARPEAGWEYSFILPTSFSSALKSFLSGARRRIGYSGEFRDILLTNVLHGFSSRSDHLSRYYIRLIETSTNESIGDIPLPVVIPPYEWGKEVSRLVGEGPYMIVAPGAEFGNAKKWPIERFAELAGKLSRDHHWRVVVIGSPKERAMIENAFSTIGVDWHNLAGKTDMGEMLSVIRGANFLVGNDSGPVHVSSAMGIPTVALFGSTSPIWTLPRGPSVEVVYLGVECSPCFKKECPRGEPICLTGIEVEDVYSVSSQLITGG